MSTVLEAKRQDREELDVQPGDKGLLMGFVDFQGISNAQEICDAV